MGQRDLVDDSANPYQPPAFQAVVVDRRGTDTVGIDLATENPFVTIWTRPRATIRGLIDADSVRRVLPIVLAAIVLGIWDALTKANGPRHFRGTDLALATGAGTAQVLRDSLSGRMVSDHHRVLDGGKRYEPRGASCTGVVVRSRGAGGRFRAGRDGAGRSADDHAEDGVRQPVAGRCRSGIAGRAVRIHGLVRSSFCSSCWPRLIAFRF